MPTAKNKKRGSQNSKRTCPMKGGPATQTIASYQSGYQSGYQSVKGDLYREYVLFLHSLTDSPTENEIARDSDD